MYSLQIPQTVVCGQEALDAMLTQIKADGVCRVWLLVDQAVCSQPKIKALTEGVWAAVEELAMVRDIPAEPSVAQVLEVYERLRTDCERPELIAAIGGGSTLDTAKIISAMVANPAYAQDVTDATRIIARPCPLYMAPTSAGTGAEATINAIVLIPQKRVKQGVIHPWFLPQKVFLCPELTRTLPPSLTAATGLDAFCHCIETYMSRCHTPFGRMYALEGMRLIVRYLFRAYRDGSDMEAREGMLLAAFYGGVAIRCSSTVAVHALSYPLGGAYRITHEIANALLLPHVIAFNMDALPDDEVFAIADAMALAQARGSRAEAERAVIDAVYAMTRELGIPDSLEAFEVHADQLDQLVSSAFGVRRLLDQNPKEMTQQDIRDIYLRLFPKEGDA